MAPSAMAQKKSSPKPRTAPAKATKSRSLARVIPTPPAGAEEEKLSVDIPKGLGWRIKLALLTMESRGEKTAKKKFVEDAIVAALDRLDHEWEVAGG